MHNFRLAGRHTEFLTMDNFTIQMTITFHFRLYVYTRTNQADSRKGYRIKYFTGCNVIINRPNGTIESPAYGVGGYPGSQECTYRVLHPEGGRLSMRFNDVRLDPSDKIQVGRVCNLNSISHCLNSSGAGITFILTLLCYVMITHANSK